MIYKHTFIITFLLSFTFLYAKEIKTLNFAPLPTKNIKKNIEEFIPLSNYLNENINVKFNYIKKKDYKDIIDSFKDGTIDIAYLGPLPLAYLMQNYKDMEPIVSIKQSNGLAKYRCVVAKFKKDKLEFDKTINVALTQPLSTCGYYMTSKLLKKDFDIDLNEQKYDYKMSHTKALLSALSGDFLVAGAKESIAKKHSTLGIHIISKSDLLPGFALVINKKTVPKETIVSIQKSILNIPQNIYKSWGGILSRGVVKSSYKDYEQLQIDFEKIPFKGNIR